MQNVPGESINDEAYYASLMPWVGEQSAPAPGHQPPVMEHQGMNLSANVNLSMTTNNNHFHNNNYFMGVGQHGQQPQMQLPMQPPIQQHGMMVGPGQAMDGSLMNPQFTPPQGFRAQGYPGYLPQQQGMMQIGPMGQQVMLMPIQQMGPHEGMEQQQYQHHQQQPMFPNNNFIQVIDPNTGGMHFVHREPVQQQNFGFPQTQYMGPADPNQGWCQQPSQPMQFGMTYTYSRKKTQTAGVPS